MTHNSGPRINGLQYIASYGDLIRAFGTNEAAGQQHWLAHGRAEGRQADTFDERQYLANYADLRAAFGTDRAAATRHFIENGFFEGRNDDRPLPPDRSEGSRAATSWSLSASPKAECPSMLSSPC